MTIIKPNENKGYFRFLAAVFSLVILGGVLYIYQYNKLVDYRYQIDSLKEEIVLMEVRNTELKDELYDGIDPIKLRSLAVSRNLVFENNPDYLNLNQWVSDSSY